MLKESEGSGEVQASVVALQRLAYRATVRGLFADVEVRQEYAHTGDAPIEVVYVFPLPDEAAVRSCTMQIGATTVTAILKKRKEAEEEYRHALDEGHHAALATQERPNVFTMNVGGIAPGEQVVVTLTYTQRVPWHAGGGRFRIPLVVAPRFIPGSPTGKSAGGWAPDTDDVPDASAITPVVANDGVSYTASVAIDLAPGFPAEVASPSHPDMIGEEVAQCASGSHQLLTADALPPDRDIIIVYKNTAITPEVTLHQGEWKGEHFALLHVVPQGTVVAEPSDIVLLLDRSGSMEGGKMDGVKTIAKRIIRDVVELGVAHRIGVAVFDNETDVLAPLAPDYDRALKAIDGIEAGGGTMLGQALTRVHQLFDDPRRPGFIVLVTDGQTEEMQFTPKKGVRVIAAGLDTAVNDTALKIVAEKTGGAVEWFYPGEDFDAVARRLLGLCTPPIVHDLRVDGVAEEVVVGSRFVHAGCPAALAVRFVTGAKLLKEIVLVGTDDKGKECRWSLPLRATDLASPERRCEVAHVLWARERLRGMDEEDLVVAMSLQYEVLSRATAFVAIAEKATPTGKPVRQEIPVSLPHGWEFEEGWGGGASAAYLCLGVAGATLGGGGTRTRGDRNPYVTTLGGDDIGCSELAGGGSMRAPSNDAPFTLDATHPADLVVALVIAVVEGTASAIEVRAAFERFSQLLTVPEVSSWSHELRLRTFYFIEVLREHGYVVKQKVRKELFATDKATPLMSAWLSLANNIRNPYRARPSVEKHGNGQTGDEWTYLRWKVGSGSRPISCSWAIVP